MLMEQLASTCLDRWSHPTPNPTVRIPGFLRGQLMAESECSVTSDHPVHFWEGVTLVTVC